MKIYIITCTYNVSQVLIDCAFPKEADAEAYAKEMNGDKAKAVARCKELIATREGEAAAKFLVEKSQIAFAVVAVELK